MVALNFGLHYMTYSWNFRLARLPFKFIYECVVGYLLRFRRGGKATHLLFFRVLVILITLLTQHPFDFLLRFHLSFMQTRFGWLKTCVVVAQAYQVVRMPCTVCAVWAILAIVKNCRGLGAWNYFLLYNQSWWHRKILVEKLTYPALALIHGTTQRWY